MSSSVLYYDFLNVSKRLKSRSIFLNDLFKNSICLDELDLDLLFFSAMLGPGWYFLTFNAGVSPCHYFFAAPKY